ncbi:MAG: DegT/DnrJ/EryC1/StrS aminotransferase family protein [Candidatus Kapabacteria bacterium]|nr:DegT/DnrJ/EryC1/StrS aminotransferase family protein [Candidatus Kapabacteria bacterium]
MKFIDLDTQYKRLKNSIDTEISKVLDSGAFIMGGKVAELEQLLADYVGVKHCISCASGTDALLMPLMAWGIGRGDAVFTTPFTFIATAEVIALTGATPVFVDIDPKSFNIDTNELESKIKQVISHGNLKAKAIIPVDLFGLMPDYSQISEIAAKYGLKVIEDAAQSFGATQSAKKAGSFGDVAATSFYPAKPLGCYGDGGAIFTNDPETAMLLQSIRVHGQGEDKYNNDRIGINGRLDTIQATILIEKMKIFDEELLMRNKIANSYATRLKTVKTQFIPESNSSAWALYSVLAKDSEHRRIIMEKLSRQGIPSVIYYPKPLHLQKAFDDLGYKKGDFPISEMISERIFSLPMHPYLTETEIKQVCEVVNSYE